MERESFGMFPFPHSNSAMDTSYLLQLLAATSTGSLCNNSFASTSSSSQSSPINPLPILSLLAPSASNLSPLQMKALLDLGKAREYVKKLSPAESDAQAPKLAQQFREKYPTEDLTPVYDFFNKMYPSIVDSAPEPSPVLEESDDPFDYVTTYCVPYPSTSKKYAAAHRPQELVEQVAPCSPTEEPEEDEYINVVDLSDDEVMEEEGARNEVAEELEMGTHECIQSGDQVEDGEDDVNVEAEENEAAKDMDMDNHEDKGEGMESNGDTNGEVKDKVEAYKMEDQAKDGERIEAVDEVEIEKNEEKGERMEVRVEEEEEEGEPVPICLICRVKEADAIYFPCKHDELCLDCGYEQAEKFRTCPFHAECEGPVYITLMCEFS